MKYSIIIPVYCSSKTLLNLCNKLIKAFENITSEDNYEIIFVDDYSNDNSREVLNDLMQKYINNNNIISIFLTKNFGQLTR